MIDVENALKTMATASAPLMALLPGGAFAFNELRPDQLNVEDYPGAYTSTGRLKQLLFIRVRSQPSSHNVRDRGERVTSVTAMVELIVYGDADSAFSAIEQAVALVHDLYDYAYIPSIGRMTGRLRDVTRGNDPVMNQAKMFRMDGAIVRVLTS